MEFESQYLSRLKRPFLNHKLFAWLTIKILFPEHYSDDNFEPIIKRLIYSFAPNIARGVFSLLHQPDQISLEPPDQLIFFNILFVHVFYCRCCLPQVIKTIFFIFAFSFFILFFRLALLECENVDRSVLFFKSLLYMLGYYLFH